MAVVVISSGGEGDRSVGSLEVKALGGRETGLIRTGGRATWQAAAKAKQEAPKYVPRVKRIAGGGECRAVQTLAKARVGIAVYWTCAMAELLGVIESGMSRRNARRKPGTTRGLPRCSRTAKAASISRIAAKSCCACEWGGWGRISVDGPGQNNPDWSEGPWGGGSPTLHGGALRGRRPGSEREYRYRPQWCTKGGCKPAVDRRMPGAGLTRRRLGRHRLIGRPSSRTGENPPYGMREGTEETSASFEVRTAPRSYSTCSKASWHSSG